MTFEIIDNGMVTENDYIDILFISTKESLTMLDIRLITSRRECWIRTTALKNNLVIKMKQDSPF